MCLSSGTISLAQKRWHTRVFRNSGSPRQIKQAARYKARTGREQVIVYADVIHWSADSEQKDFAMLMLLTGGNRATRRKSSGCARCASTRRPRQVRVQVLPRQPSRSRAADRSRGSGSGTG